MPVAVNNLKSFLGELEPGISEGDLADISNFLVTSTARIEALELTFESLAEPLDGRLLFLFVLTDTRDQLGHAFGLEFPEFIEFFGDLRGLPGAVGPGRGLVRLPTVRADRLEDVIEHALAALFLVEAARVLETEEMRLFVARGRLELRL